MSIAADEIKFYLSTKLGSAGASQAQGNPNNALGKYISTTEVSTVINQLFDIITGIENAAEVEDYRCIFIMNTSDETAYGVRIWINSETSGGANISLGLDPAGITNSNSSAAQAAEIATELDVPAGVTFSEPANIGESLLIGDMAPGQVAAIWYRRSAQNSLAKNVDGVVLGWYLDSGE